MIGAGNKAGLILHALRQIGKENVNVEMIEQIKSQIEEKDVKHISIKLSNGTTSINSPNPLFIMFW